MSLAEKYQEFREKLNANENVPLSSLKVAEYFAQSVREAFYAGAEATYKAWNDQHSPNDCAAEMKKLRAEIDHFRSHK